MDAIVLNAKIIGIVKDMLPEEASLQGFLCETLPLNKDSVYRRLRGDVVFSFHEVYLLARKLDLSLDFLMKSAEDENPLFELVKQPLHGTTDNYTRIPNRFEQILGHVLEEPTSKFELSHNLFPQVPANMFYHLSKYISFKWMYKSENPQRKAIPFKQIDYPRNLFQMHKGNNLGTMKIKETSYIWDRTIVEMLVREIKYFTEINLLDKEDVEILRNELHEYLYYVEELTIKGVFQTGNKVNIYISAVNTDTAYSYMETPKYRICIIGAFDFHYLISTDNTAFEMMKEKIISLKKGATLITQSNEMYRVSFFREQHEWVDSL